MTRRLLPCRRPAALLALLLGFGLTGASAAQVAETEPNSTCATPQPVTSSFPAIVTGSLDTPPEVTDVDYFQLSATAGSLVTIDLEGAPTGQGTLSDPYLGVFEPGCNAAVAIDDDGGTGTNSRVTFLVPAGGVFVVAASSFPDYSFGGFGGSAGSYRLSLREETFAEAVTGRVVNVDTGAPVFQAALSLQRCDDGVCQYLGSAYSDATGAFRFDSSNVWTYLLAGEYRIEIQANSFLARTEGPFQVAGGGVTDLGDLALEPVPTISQIRGRVVDLQTGAPLPGTAVPYAWVELIWCDPNWFYCYAVRQVQVDAGGNFRFDGTTEAPLLPGEYFLRLSAEQYQPLDTERFPVGENGVHDTGPIGLKSFPVRINLSQVCNTVPAAGGTCQYTVRIANGLSERLKGQTWGIAQVYGTGSPAGSTTFQLSNSSTVNLAPGQFVDVPFSFAVPGTVAGGASICIRGFVAQHTSPFNTVGSRDLFCLSKEFGAFRVVPEARKRDALKKAKGE